MLRSQHATRCEAPAVDAEKIPESSEVTLAAADGYELAATYHPSPSGADPDVAAVVASASATPRGFYTDFASHLAGEGVAVLTFDYRGIGDSAPERMRGFEATQSDWGRLDLAAAVDWLAGERRHDAVHLVGHSVGGQLAGLAPNAGRLESIVGVAAQSGYWRHWPGWRKWTFAELVYLLLPTVSHLVGYLPTGRLGVWPEDLPKGVALEWARWCRDPRYVLGQVPDETRRQYESLDVPLLAFSFEGDPLAPRPAVDAWTDMYPEAPGTRRHVEGEPDGPLGHFGFFQGDRPDLWAEVVHWILHGAEVARHVEEVGNGSR